MKFEAGKTYEMTSVCDHNCKWSFQVVKRTAKTVTLDFGAGQNFRRGISVYQNEETCFPLGKYSMAPILGACKEVTG